MLKIVFCVLVLSCYALARPPFTKTHLKFQYPPGIDPAHCPNFPFCAQLINPSSGKIVMTIPGYPAGVNPIACPNYPTCNENLDPLTGVAKTPAGIHPADWPNWPHPPKQ